ncbi:MAG: DUF2752 domain-containing protein [Bacteroidia bacterium]
MEISIIPNFIMKYYSNDYWKQNDINILVSNILVISFFILFSNSIIELMNIIPHFCLIEKLFGIDCPVCGFTRAFGEMSNGNIQKAASLNFSSLLVAFYFVFQIPIRLFSIFKTNQQTKINKISKYLGQLIFVTIIASWAVKTIIILT